MYASKALMYYIEYKRSVMIEAANDYGMTNEITLRHSQELDKLLNEYSRMQKLEKSK